MNSVCVCVCVCVCVHVCQSAPPHGDPWVTLTTITRLDPVYQAQDTA